MTNNGVIDKHDLALAAASNFDELALNDTGFCNLCGAKAETKCDRCGDFYCSEICQRKDWQNHRYICFPMPKLVKTRRCSSLKNDIVRDDSQSQTTTTALSLPQSNNMPPHGSCVLLTGFKSSNRCFVRSTNPSILSENKKVLDEIDEFGKKSASFSENPKTNAYALALREDKWCRVQILGGRKDNYYRIRFIDFGDISRRYLKDLRRVSRSIINLPCFNKVVQLKDIVNFSSDSKLLESLSKYTNMEYRIEFVQPDTAGGNVKLYNSQNNTLLNSLILEIMSQSNDKDMERASTTSSLSNSNEEQKNGLEKPVMNGNSNKKDCGNSSAVENNAESIVSHSLSVANPAAAKKKPAPSPRQIQMHKPCLQPNGLEKPVMNGNSNKKDCGNSSAVENNAESIVSHSLSVANPAAAKKKPAPSPRQIQMHKPCLQPNGLEKPVMNGNSNKKDCGNSSAVENNAESIVSHSLSVANPAAAKKKPAPSPRQIQMHKPCLQPPFEIIPLNEKDRNCKIIIVDDSYTGSGYIGCLLDKNCENLNAVAKFLEEYKVSDQSYKPKINEYCLAMFENDWYRAKVVEIISEDKYLVVYIDFTNEMELSSKLIRRYPMSLTLPCCTTLCALDGLPEDISDELKNFLELNCKSFTHLNIDNIRLEDDVCYVESKELLNKIRNAKLL